MPAAVLEMRNRSGQAVDEVLRRRVEASGDLTDDRDLAQGLRSFQDHHGLRSTGALDAATVTALNVPLSDRIHQIELNLERWRWMPDELGARHIRINIPRFYLEVHEGARPTLDMRVVVGRRGDETPTFSSNMTHVVLSPYWNIPETIVTDETLPSLERDPSYLVRNSIEIVRQAGSGAKVVDPSTIDWNDERTLKRLSFRQRPGSSNALGVVKFMFPNPYHVYIHDTPADALFNRVGRTFSHGCVRIEDPMRFARYVLRDQPTWTEQAIHAAMYSGSEQHVRLNAPIPVHIVYFTSWVDERGGVHFRDDVYGYDRKQQLARNTAVVGGAARIS